MEGDCSLNTKPNAVTTRPLNAIVQMRRIRHIHDHDTNDDWANGGLKSYMQKSRQALYIEIIAYTVF